MPSETAKTTKLQKPATNARSKPVLNAPGKCERNYCVKNMIAE